MANKTIYVALEGALLSAPKAYLNIGKKGDVIVVPISVISSLYNFNGIKRIFATEICEYLSKIHLEEPFLQENGTFIRIVNTDNLSKDYSIPSCSCLTDAYSKVLWLCKQLQVSDYPNCEVVLLSQNPVLLMYAMDLKIKCKHVYDTIFPDFHDRYTGLSDIYVSDEEFYMFMEKGKFPYRYSENGRLYENQFVIIHNSIDGTKIGRYSLGYVHSLHYLFDKKFTPKNVQQMVLQESLYAPPCEAPLVIASGVAGTGKTYTTISAALNQTDCGNLFPSNYKKIIIATPAVTDGGENLGYLPGDIIGKLRPYFGGIIDNILELLAEKTVKTCGNCGEYNYQGAQNTLQSYLDNGLIEIQSLGFLAGHSFKNCFVIVDEAQNIDPNFFINIVTRIGENSKLVILGDPYQVKTPNLSRKMNGIVYMMETWKDEPLAWQVEMNPNKSIRSKLSQRAIEIMS